MASTKLARNTTETEPRYVVDEFTQESYCDDTVNVNHVIRRRKKRQDEGQGLRVVVRYDDNFLFDSAS